MRKSETIPESTASFVKRLLRHHTVSLAAGGSKMITNKPKIKITAEQEIHNTYELVFHRPDVEEHGRDAPSGKEHALNLVNEIEAHSRHSFAMKLSNHLIASSQSSL